LGGNRKGFLRTYFNLIVVFFLTGLWHGASWNFVIWGMFHGFFLVVERSGFNKILQKIPAFFSHFYVLIVVIISWVFFRADNLSHSLLFLKKMFIPTNGNGVLNNYLSFFHINAQTIIALIVAIIFSMPVYPKFKNLITSEKLIWLNYSFLIILLLLSIIYLTADTYNPFIYYRF
jgi:alginate O-acetyltransferase complex protein AlgI